MNNVASFIACLLKPWTWQMAWRDSRRSRRRLLLYTSSIVLGIAALTAISSFGRQMQKAIQDQSKTLLGADLVVSSRDAYTPDQEKILASMPGEKAREIAFPSMVYFVKSEGTRLVQIRALEGEFPFYGSFETIPDSAVTRFRKTGGALVERNLMDLYDAKVGDEIKVGEIKLPIVGVLTKVPGETMAFGTIAPRVYIPLSQMSATGLLKEGSLARYKSFFKFPTGVDGEEYVESRRAELEGAKLGFDTVAERQNSLGRSMSNMLRYLNLIGFVALLLGGVGVASGIHVHIKQKLGTVATLRCLGCSVPQAFAIYFAQAMALGLFGALVGALLGMAVQVLIPTVVADFIPFPLPAAVSWMSLLSGISIGFVICLLFALLPLLSVRKISPLAAFRAAFSHEADAGKDPLVWVAYALIGVGLVLFGIAQSRRWQEGVAFAGGIAFAFLFLALVAAIIVRVTRRIVPTSWPFVWRQGLSNLYRPNNRTVLMMISLGLGTFLVLTLYLVQTNLLRELLPSERSNEGNTVLFDIQPDQKDAVVELLKSQQLPVLENVPMVSMRLQSVKGRSVEEIRKDPKSDIRGWVLNREYRSTYRAKLAPTEKLLRGTWHETVQDSNAPVPISIEQGIADNLKVGLGDEIVFDVQGVPVAAKITSVRDVDWKRMAPNFFVVFPMGAIEEAPAMHVLVTRIESAAQSTRLQREVVRQFPNVSTVDVTLVLQTVEAVLKKVAFVIRFMALFTVGTGVLVLAGTIVSGRYQRLRESILLRTLGATRAQVLQILTAEYLFLGLLAALTSIVLAVGASWGLSVFIFKVKFGFYPAPLLIALGAVSLLTIVAGVLGNRVLLNRPPLEVLRDDS